MGALEESWATPWEVSEAVGLWRAREERRRVRHPALVVIEVAQKLRLPLPEVACQEFPLQAEVLGVRRVFQAVGEEAPFQAGHGEATGAPILVRHRELHAVIL